MKNLVLVIMLALFSIMGNAQKTVVYFDSSLNEKISIGLGCSYDKNKFILSVVNETLKNDSGQAEFIVNGNNFLETLNIDTVFIMKVNRKKVATEYDYLIEGNELLKLLNILRNEPNVYICGERFLGNDVFIALNNLNRDFVGPDLRERFFQSLPEHQKDIAKNSHIRFGFSNHRTIAPPFMFFRMPYMKFN